MILPSLQGVLSLESEFWMHRRYVHTSDSIPWKTKEELIQAYLLTKRCEEDECMLKTDMLSTVKYWYDQVQSITLTLQEIGDLKNQYELGLRCLLQQYKLVAELQHGQAVNIFSRFIQIPCEVLLESTAVTATEVHQRRVTLILILILNENNISLQLMYMQYINFIEQCKKYIFINAIIIAVT